MILIPTTIKCTMMSIWSMQFLSCLSYVYVGITDIVFNISPYTLFHLCSWAHKYLVWATYYSVNAETRFIFCIICLFFVSLPTGKLNERNFKNLVVLYVSFTPIPQVQTCYLTSNRQIPTLAQSKKYAHLRLWA